MRRNRSFILLILVLLSACTLNQQLPPVQSPQIVSRTVPPPDPASDSNVVTRGEWCFLQFRDADWYLCNIHYHSEAEHGIPAGTERAIPPCPGAESDSGPADWVEIHYAYVKPPIAGTCPALHARALTTDLGRDCAAPYIVRAVWARLSNQGTFLPKTNALPDSARYVEYDGSSTGNTGGTSPAWWKISRDCLTVTPAALVGVHRDPPRKLQRPAGTRISTKDRP